MTEITDKQANLLAYGAIPVFIVTFFLNYALAEGYAWTVPGSLLGSVGAFGYAVGLIEIDSKTREKLAYASLLGLLVWVMILFGFKFLGIPDPGPHLVAGLYLHELNHTLRNTVLMVGLFAWLLYIGQELMEEHGVTGNPEAEKLGMEVDEHGVPLQEQSDE